MNIDLKAILARLRNPRNLNWKTAAVVVAVVVAGVLIYRGTRDKVTFLFSEANAVAGNTIAGALERFKVGTGKYPEKLALLKPAYLAEIPPPVPETNFVYAVSSDGKECWFAYQIPDRGVLNEYECGSRKWAYREYEDSDSLRAFRKEFVRGPKGS